MRILAIETSCDDTCVAVGEGKVSLFDFEILANIVSSQIKIHQPFGGIWPTLAKREHQKNLIPVLIEALKKSGLLVKRKTKREISKKEINIFQKIFQKEKGLFLSFQKFVQKYKKPKVDFIAVTIGPGLEPCLFCGINLARALSFWLKKKIISVNHIEAHIFSCFLSEKNKELLKKQSLIFPAIGLIVSGGHTQLLLIKKLGKYKILGETRDDAAGEAFDKTARILGLSYPGGPAIEKLAKLKTKGKDFKITLPRPMIFAKNYDFSFSGLKTAVLYNFQKQEPKIKKSKSYKVQMAKEIQEAIGEVLVKKTIKAQIEFKAKSIILGGGVSANQRLKELFHKEIQKLSKKPLFIYPEKVFSTDNAAMIAFCGYFYAQKSGKMKNKMKKWSEVKAYPNLRIS